MRTSPFAALRRPFGHRGRRRARAVLAAAVLALVPASLTVAVVAPAQAATGSRWGYVFANSPTTASYTPSLAYQKQSNGKHVTIQRSGTGLYTLTFHGLATRTRLGVVHVTLYSGTGSCQTDGWGGTDATATSPGNVIADVRCFAPGGAPADRAFTAMYTYGAGTPAFAYAVDNLPSSSGTLDPFYSFDGKGGQLTSTHVGVGAYRVTIPHLAGGNGTVKVTADATVQALCTVISWTAGFVDVQCADAAGNPLDIPFVISFATKLPLVGVSRTNGYVWNSLLASTYQDTDAYHFVSGGGTAFIQHSVPGGDVVQFSGFGQNHGDVQVTAYGNVPGVTCNTGGWNALGTPAVESVIVDCYDPLGHPVDSLFTMQFTL